MKEEDFKRELTKIVMDVYLPKLKTNVIKYIDENVEKYSLIQSVSNIVGVPVATEIGILRVAKPTTELIDDIVKLYGKTK